MTVKIQWSGLGLRLPLCLWQCCGLTLSSLITLKVIKSKIKCVVVRSHQVESVHVVWEYKGRAGPWPSRFMSSQSYSTGCLPAFNIAQASLDFPVGVWGLGKGSQKRVVGKPGWSIPGRGRCTRKADSSCWHGSLCLPHLVLDMQPPLLHLYLPACEPACSSGNHFCS